MSSELVTFKGGFAASWLVVSRLLDLESRGATFHLIDDDRFRVDPPALLTRDDISFLRQHQAEARSCVEYVEQIIAEPVC